MYIKKFNEEIGFDDEELRDRLEIPNLKGELDPNSPDMKTFYHPGAKLNTRNELKKLFYRYPVLERFVTDEKIIEGSILKSFFATSKVPVNNQEYYAQLSFAYHNGQYYISIVARKREDFQDISKWSIQNFFFEKMEDTYNIADAFIRVCKKLGILTDDDVDTFAYLAANN